MWFETMLANNAQYRRDIELDWKAISKAVYYEAANNVLLRQYPNFWNKEQTLKSLVYVE